MLRELANNLEPNTDTTADEQVFPNRAACLKLNTLRLLRQRPCPEGLACRLLSSKRTL